MIQIKLTGVEEIDKVFRGLPTEFQDKILREAHARALRPTVERAHLLAPVGLTGNLAESIGVVTAKGDLFGNRSELGLVNAGPRRKGRYKGYHGHLVEFGTRQRKNKNGADRGTMPAKPFMEPAWEQTKGQVESSIAEQLGRRVYAFMKRVIKNNG